MNVYWLRPETALWRAIDIEIMKDFTFESPSLDLGCGDGIFSFIRAGGEFHNSFDMFRSVGKVDHFFDNVDVYDFFEKKQYMPIINKKPNYKIDIALDYKQSLLNKANSLNLYDKLVVHDANENLPFEDNSFKTIFSNILYWLDNPHHIFAEIYRILMPGGKIALMVPNKQFVEYSFYYRMYLKYKDDPNSPNDVEEWAWLSRIDRGRLSDNIKQAKTSEEWENIFKKSQLKIREHKMHLSKTVIEVWDIGLRPLFPVLYKMTDKLNEDDRSEIKKEWVKLVYSFIEPLCKTTWLTDTEYPPAFHYYILEKSI